MKALVIYESMFGNTHAVADAIGEGLATGGVEVTVAAVDDTDPTLVDDIDFLVIGGPTHAHGMTRPGSRQSAIDIANKEDSGLSLDPSSQGPGVRGWLESMEGLDIAVAAAAFDTRVDAPALLTGRASKGIDASLAKLGCRRAAEPESFLVSIRNELVTGELDRAQDWGSMLAGRLVPTG